MRDFAGRVAVVTGGGQRHRARAGRRRFAGLGMQVALADVESPALGRACGLKSRGVRARSACAPT